ncbi:hypothetical protein B0H12DRAFT_1246920 [Mycena haematopus]|nr:hypothetical protein B0H12DRAFT_1246920 [Mycena haematopus]
MSRLKATSRLISSSLLVKSKERNEKARLQIAKKREEIKNLPSEEQDVYKQKARDYSTKYRENHRRKLAQKAQVRRRKIYQEKYDATAWVKKRMAKLEAGLQRDIKAGFRDPYPGDLDDLYDEDPDLHTREQHM